MIINHRGIIPSRFDAPFLGTLICAANCSYHCPGCFHQELDNPLISEDADSLLDNIHDDPFCEGVILAGLEWTEQYDEMICLIEGARKRELEVILYTHYTKEEIREYYPALMKYTGMYIKCGMYDKSKLVTDNVHYGVPLASSNQEIIRI